MKRVMIFTMALIAVALVITAVFPIFAIDLLPPDPSMAADSPVEMSGVPEIPDVPAEASFEVVTSPWGRFQQIAGANDGFYHFYPSGKGVDIHFYEYSSSGRRTVGRIEHAIGGIGPVVAGGYLYAFKQGITPAPLQKLEGDVGFIQKFSLGGESQGRIDFKSNQTLGYGMIAFDGESVVFILNEWNEEDRMTAAVLCKADFQSGKIVELAVVNDSSYTAIVGVYPGGLVLEESAIYLREDENGNLEGIPELTMMLYDVGGESVRTKHHWVGGDRTYVFDGDGNMYYNEFGSKELRKLNLQSDADELVCEDLSLGYENVCFELTGVIQDGHISYTIAGIDNDAHASCAFNLVASEAFEIKFTFLSGDRDGRLVEIRAETDTHFVVLHGMNYIPTSYIDENGVEIRFDEQVFDYALIKKTDYWASRPNFIALGLNEYLNNSLRG